VAFILIRPFLAVSLINVLTLPKLQTLKVARRDALLLGQGNQCADTQMMNATMDARETLFVSVGAFHRAWTWLFSYTNPINRRMNFTADASGGIDKEASHARR